MFELHPALRQDCLVVGHFRLSVLLLMNDANYPWFILVPARPDVREIYELAPDDQIQLMRESSLLAGGLAREFGADKMNIAALGNIVPQLHVHHIVRYRGDPAWPAPVWGKCAPRPYGDAERRRVLARLAAALPAEFAFSG